MKTKILQMPIRNARGGITQYALRNWTRIDKSRFRFDWVTLDPKLDFEDALREQGCKVHYLSCRQEKDEVRFRAEMEAIFAEGYGALHLHTSFWRGFLAEELAIQSGIPRIIVHAHSTGIDVADPAVRKRLEDAHNMWKSKFDISLATHFVACSKLAADFLFGPNIPRKRITVLRNGIDTSAFGYDEQKRREMRKLLEVEDRFVLLQSGRLTYSKNHRFTIEMFAEYSRQNPKAVLLIVGDGSLRNEMAALSKPLGAAVRFLGFREDIAALLMTADVFLQPSLFEGFSIASVEAQCSGIPWLVSENVSEAALPFHRVALPLQKAVWIEMLDKIYKNPSRNTLAAKQLKDLGWDISTQIGVLEALYSSNDCYLGRP